ncbi:sialic acid synthase [Magnetovibrio blakemorei]|uniref:Sialic acid synthase n=2 Tax=Magnetovibrio blakemorei TaxID=28181 RepID=A0A1E5Q6D9_9PROT|nr:sialic acid synthase [Magnetovibrio blakemorei]OEJ66121.1 sialic acid synthase [Magnetovibrio blakemorei]
MKKVEHVNSNVTFNFENLFVLDLANNHQGSVAHATKVIQSLSQVVQKHGVNAALKFQFRQLDTFIHPMHQKDSDNNHIPRFLSTRLARDDFQKLLDVAQGCGFKSMCTPFDEESVDVITEMGFDIIKIASCSAKDWPLLNKVAEAGLPVIFSTGGLELRNIDDVVSFFEHRGVDFAIMHCVSIYPIPREKFNLNQITTLKARYPDHVVGWSTHEAPSMTVPIQIAVAKGAQMFERHVGMEAEGISLNAYSSTPEQIDTWISSWKEALVLCGANERPATSIEEANAIASLRRGVYAKKPIKKGVAISRDQVYFAMPYVDDQLESGAWKDGIVSQQDIGKDDPVLANQVNVPHNTDQQIIKTAVHEVKAMLNDAKIVLGSDFEVEYSHHYGIKNFTKTGAVIINCINREYCKKLIVQLPNQDHPEHFHKLKEETFQILSGTLHVKVEGKTHTLEPGDTCLVQPGVWHSFWTDTGCIFEEVSTTHYNDDSYYKDKAINKLERHQRKTKVDHWGRFQLELMVK